MRGEHSSKLRRPSILAAVASGLLITACGSRSATNGEDHAGPEDTSTGPEDTSTESGSSASEGEVVECETIAFEDSSLELYVRYILGIENGPISGEALQALVTIEVTQESELPEEIGALSSLGGLECARNLETLHWIGAAVADLSPLAELSKLRVLRLPGIKDELVDLGPLAGLTELEELDLRVAFGPGKISNLTPLAGLGKLRWLEIVGHSIVDVSPLNGLTQLEHINLAANSITDFSLLPDCPWLMLYLNPVSDVSPLADFTELTYINFGATSVADLIPLVGKTWQTPEGCADLFFQYDILSEFSQAEVVPQICAANPQIAVWISEDGPPSCNPNSSCKCPGDWFCE